MVQAQGVQQAPKPSIVWGRWEACSVRSTSSRAWCKQKIRGAKPCVFCAEHKVKGMVNRYKKKKRCERRGCTYCTPSARLLAMYFPACDPRPCLSAGVLAIPQPSLPGPNQGTSPATSWAMPTSCVATPLVSKMVNASRSRARSSGPAPRTAPSSRTRPARKSAGWCWNSPRSRLCARLSHTSVGGCSSEATSAAGSSRFPGASAPTHERWHPVRSPGRSSGASCGERPAVSVWISRHLRKRSPSGWNRDSRPPTAHSRSRGHADLPMVSWMKIITFNGWNCLCPRRQAHFTMTSGSGRPSCLNFRFSRRSCQMAWIPVPTIPTFSTLWKSHRSSDASTVAAAVLTSVRIPSSFKMVLIFIVLCENTNSIPTFPGWSPPPPATLVTNTSSSAEFPSSGL
mmetsp:Transcript_35192/g.61449  ORF Transcript_35192/g.61449 Transcript_35192/m.61449 type:complete len:399 (+) Transcript_35192:133-1329(+)